MNETLGSAYTCKKPSSTRVRKDTWKRTVSITLTQTLLEQAKNHSLNISRITEQALSSIIDYLQAQNQQTSSEFLSPGSVLKKEEGRGRDLNPGARLHRPIGYQATSPRPLFE